MPWNEWICLFLGVSGFLQVILSSSGLFMSFAFDVAVTPATSPGFKLTFSPTPPDWTRCCSVRSCCGSCWSSSISSRLPPCCSRLLGLAKLLPHSCEAAGQGSMSPFCRPEEMKLSCSLWFTAVALYTETLLSPACRPAACCFETSVWIYPALTEHWQCQHSSCRGGGYLSFFND